MFHIHSAFTYSTKKIFEVFCWDILLLNSWFLKYYGIALKSIRFLQKKMFWLNILLRTNSYVYIHIPMELVIDITR